MWYGSRKVMVFSEQADGPPYETSALQHGHLENKPYFTFKLFGCTAIVVSLGVLSCVNVFCYLCQLARITSKLCRGERAAHRLVVSCSETSALATFEKREQMHHIRLPIDARLLGSIAWIVITPLSAWHITCTLFGCCLCFKFSKT